MKWFQKLRSGLRVPLKRDYISDLKKLWYASSVLRIGSGAYRSWLEATPTILILSGSGILPRSIQQWATQLLGPFELLK